MRTKYNSPTEIYGEVQISLKKKDELKEQTKYLKLFDIRDKGE